MANKLTIEEQIYCLQYEFDVLAEFITKGHVERWVHNCISAKIEAEHLERYQYAMQYAKNKKVLDIAGGSGYGTYLLATEGEANEVHSVDLDEAAVKYADIKYKHSSIQRKVGNAVTYVQESYYDLIVSFETIEHVDDYHTFLDNLYKSLVKNGSLIISSPVVQHTTHHNLNKYHNIEWSFNDFQKLLQDKFDIQDVYVQSIILTDDLKDSLFSRIKRKLLNESYVEREKSVFEKYNRQYNPNDIVAGYQMIHCVKK